MHMKKCLFYLTLFCLLSACQKSGPSGPKATSAPPLGTINLSDFAISDIAGTDLQKAIKKDTLGRILEEGLLHKGKRHGTWVVYFETKDIPFRIMNLEEGAFSGVFLEYSHLGQLELIANYANNELDGRWAKFKNGFKTETREYKNGRLNGLLTKYYKGMDVVQQASQYEDDLLNGTSKFYDQKGKMVDEVVYRKGVRI